MEGIKKALTTGIITQEEAVAALQKRFGLSTQEAIDYLAS